MKQSGAKRGDVGSRLHDGETLPQGFILGSSWGDGTRVTRGANGGWVEGVEGKARREVVCRALCSIVL